MLLLLNEYCLDAIFQELTLDELMSLHGELHSRIDAAIERQLWRFAHFECSMREPPLYGSEKLQLLGRHLQSISIIVGYSMRPEEVLAILHPLCVGASMERRLRALKLQYINCTSDFVATLNLVAPLLRVLDVTCTNEDDIKLMIGPLQSALKLHTLALTMSEFDELFLQRSLLERLRYLVLMKFYTTLPYEPELLSQQYKQLTIQVYDILKLTFESYGPLLHRSPDNKWYHEYFKDNSARVKEL